jgi:hypothetical protein
MIPRYAFISALSILQLSDSRNSCLATLEANHGEWSWYASKTCVEGLTCGVKEFKLHGQKASTCPEWPACSLCWRSLVCHSIENKTLLLSENTRTNAGEWQVEEIVAEDQAR